MRFLDRYQALIEDAIIKHRLIESPIELYDPINYIINLGGKRLRPVMLLMASDLFDGDINKAIKPALGIEYFHNFSLIHDDIMDEAPLRRNQPTVHTKYNTNIALLSGDALLIKSFQMIEDLDNDLFKSCFSLFSNSAIKICEGQQYDMNFEQYNTVSFEQYLEMISCKTAILCACALKMGALIANATSNDTENIYQFGLKLGIAFQLMDDYLDVFGNKDIIGKQHAGDIHENKKTILYILAQQHANPEEKKELNFWFNQKEITSEKVNKVIDIFKKLQVDYLCSELILKYTNEAEKYLSLISVDENKKNHFYELMDYLLVREK